MRFAGVIRRILESKGKRTAAYVVCFLIGVGFGGGDVGILAILLFVMLGMSRIAQTQSHTFLAICVVVMLLGTIRVSILESPEITKGERRIEQTITQEVEYRSKTQRVVLDIDNQKTLVWLQRYPTVQVGDTIRFTCTLEKPKPFDGFSYDKYLESRGITQQCGGVDSVVIASHASPTVIGSIFTIKETFSQTISKLFPEPHASFLAGILYGERAGIPEKYTEQFAITGTSHILAISGYNITIITIALLSLLTSLLIPRKKAVWSVLGGIVLFVIFVGSGASVTRAAIMGMVPLFARMVGRLTSPVFVLIHVAGLMVLHSPLILIYDPGFQLSFVATLGLIILTPKLLKKSEWLPDSILDIKETAVATLAAIIFTLPLILYHFGQLSLTALPVNILVIPVMPLIMATGFIAMLAGIISPILGMIFATIPYLLLSYVLAVIEIASKIPYGALSVEFGIELMIAAYIVMLIFIYTPIRPKPKKDTTADNETWNIVEHS